MPKKPPVIDTADYIRQHPDAAPQLQGLVDLITAAWPNAEAAIKWGQPFYLIPGNRASIAAYKAHVSLLMQNDLTPEQTAAAQAAGYDVGQKRLNINFDQPVPADLVNDLLS